MTLDNFISLLISLRDSGSVEGNAQVLSYDPDFGQDAEVTGVLHSSDMVKIQTDNNEDSVPNAQAHGHQPTEPERSTKP